MQDGTLDYVLCFFFLKLGTSLPPFLEKDNFVNYDFIMTFPNILDLIQIILWSIVYILIIFFGVLKKCCLMPLLPLSFNLSWEVARCIKLNWNNLPQAIGLVTWMLLDIVIFVIHMKYGGVFFSKTKKRFYVISLAILLGCLLVIIPLSFLVSQFLLYFSFSDNLFMSLLFLIASLRKGAYRIEWTVLAVFRLFGTLSATIVNGLFVGNQAILILGILILILDFLAFVFSFLSSKHQKCCPPQS